MLRAELVRRLMNFGDAVTPKNDGSVLVFRSWADQEMLPELRIEVSADVERRLSALEVDGMAVFPDAEPAEAALRLLLVHVDEEVRSTSNRHLKIDETGVHPVPA